MCNPLWRQRRRVFSHANGHKGDECHPAIDFTKQLAAVVAIRPFERGRIVGLREAGWTYRRIAVRVNVRHNVSMVCRCFQQWSVEHSHTSRATDVTSRSTYCASSDGRPNSIQGRSPGACCTFCVTKDNWEQSAWSRTQITRASGQVTTYTSKPPSATTLVS